MVTKEILKAWMLENNGAILTDLLHEDVFTGYILFTPERAKLALENNKKNRRLGVRTQIPMLRAMIRNGLWDENVSKINFDKECILSDGQNRLESIAEENVPCRCMVTVGVNKTAQMVTDRRGTRMLSDDIEIAGYQNANRLAAITRINYAREIQKNTVYQVLYRGSRERSEVDPILFDYFVKNDGRIILENKLIVGIMNSVSHLKIDKSILNVLVPEFNRINETDAHGFWYRLSVGGGTTDPTNPIVRLNKRLTDNAKDKNSDLPKITQAALIIKAWNLYMRGETTGTLKYTAGGEKPEPFPKIYNPYTETEIE